MSATTSRVLAPLVNPPEDPRFDPRFERLRAEVAKLDGPTGGAIDWPTVETSALEVLAGVSKDLLVACQWAVASARVHGAPRFVEGLDLVRELVVAYGDALEPRRPRARANAVAWLVEHGARALEETSAGLGKDRLESGTHALANALRPSLGDATPSFEPLVLALSRAPADARDASDGGAPVSSSAERTAPAPSDSTATRAATEGSSSPDAAESASATDAGPATAEPAPANEPTPAPPTLAALVGPYLEPIPGECATGIDAKYDPAYVWLDREIGKLASATSVPEWKRIAAEADRLLRAVTKDVLVASYLAAAWIELEGMAAMPRALALPSALLERFDQELHPPPSRPKRRANALAFLLERCVPRLSAHVPSADDRDLAESVRATARLAASAIRGSLGEDAPATRPLLDEAERFVLGVPAPVKVVDPAPSTTRAAEPETKPQHEPAPTTARAESAPSASSTSSLAVPAALAAPANLDDVVPYLSRTGQMLADLAGALRRAAPSEPRAYRLLRIALYLHIEAPPPPKPGGGTHVPAPPDALLQRVATMAANSKWDAILEETESALLLHRFAFDLQRYSVVALRALGHTAAADAILGEVRTLFARVPEIATLSFANGVAFADDATRRFFAPTSGDEKRGAAPGVDAEGFSAFLATLADGKLAEAFEQAEALVRAAREGRGRFETRLALARALASNGRADLARLFHEALDDEARSRGLDAWDPDLCLAHLEGFVEVERALTPNGAKNPRVTELVSRIARISPSAVLRWVR